MEPDAAATPTPAAELPAAELPAAVTPPTTTLEAAAEVRRLDVATTHEKALGILASLKAQQAAIAKKHVVSFYVLFSALWKWLYCVLYVLYYITYYIILCIVPP